MAEGTVARAGQRAHFELGNKHLSFQPEDELLVANGLGCRCVIVDRRF